MAFILSHQCVIIAGAVENAKDRHLIRVDPIEDHIGDMDLMSNAEMGVSRRDCEDGRSG